MIDWIKAHCQRMANGIFLSSFYDIKPEKECKPKDILKSEHLEEIKNEKKDVSKNI